MTVETASRNSHTVDNPPAFPRDHRHLGHNGMTLRDWFAGQFLSRGSAQDDEPLDLPSSHDDADRIVALRKHWALVAEAAYIAADAMLAERAKATAQ